MSGPKCSEWEVRENRLREERARRAALAELRALFVDVEKLQGIVLVERARVGTHIDEEDGTLPPQPSENESRRNLESSLSLLRAFRATLEGEKSRIAAISQMASLLAQASSQLSAESGVDFTASKAIVETRSKTVKKLMERLPGGIPADRLQQLMELADQLIRSPTDRTAERIENNLRRYVQQEQDAANRRKRDLEVVNELHSLLRGYDDPACTAIALQLQEVEAGRRVLDARMEARARSICNEAKTRSDREYVAQILSEEFKRLGYEVGERFNTVFLHGGTMILNRPDQDEYGVEIACESERQTMRTRVVRLHDDEIAGAERALRDTEAEEKWCEDHYRLCASAGGGQVQVRLTEQIRAGSSPVPLAPGLKKFESASHRNQNMEMPRVMSAQTPRRKGGDQ